MDTLSPPTDNLYKFIAIAGLAGIILCLIFFFRQQATLQEKWLDAHLELVAGGYQEGTGIPAESTLRQAYLRRQASIALTNELFRKTPLLIVGVVISVVFAIGGFLLWWFRVQRHEDAILRATAARSLQEKNP